MCVCDQFSVKNCVKIWFHFLQSQDWENVIFLCKLQRHWMHLSPQSHSVSLHASSSCCCVIIPIYTCRSCLLSGEHGGDTDRKRDHWLRSLQNINEPIFSISAPSQQLVVAAHLFFNKLVKSSSPESSFPSVLLQKYQPPATEHQHQQHRTLANFSKENIIV